MYKEDIKIYYDIKHTPRDIQVEALEFTKHNIRRGKKYVMLNMPTGSGKSLFGMMFINWYLNYINKDAKFDILTNSKILQRQYTDEFPFISSLKGKNSYRCHDYPDSSCEEGKEMNKALKRTCSDCPYDKAFAGWKTNRVALTNFHLFDTLHLFQPGIIREKEPNVLIIDEAHDFEAVLCDYISNKISKISLKKMGFTEAGINNVFHDIKNIKYIYSFVEYIENEFLNKLTELEETITKKLSNSSYQMKDKVKFTKNLTAITASISSYKSFLDDYKINSDNWVLDTEQTEDKLFYKNFTIQPVWSHKYLKDIIWEKYDHVVFMSGTLLNQEMFSYLNGIENELSVYHDVESPFPVKNRPIYYMKTLGKMSYKDKVETWEKQKVIIDKIINKYKDKKGIIHTNSFEFSKWIEESYKNNDRFIFHDSTNRDDALQEHLNSERPTIIVSPSMGTGVDLKGKLSEFQIIVKIPFPSLNSSKVKKRMSDNKDWYGYKTCCDLIQSTGRSVRDFNDHADTFILDGSFGDILKYNHKYLPHWFTESIKILK